MKWSVRTSSSVTKRTGVFVLNPRSASNGASSCGARLPRTQPQPTSAAAKSRRGTDTTTINWRPGRSVAWRDAIPPSATRGPIQNSALRGVYGFSDIHSLTREGSRDEGKVARACRLISFHANTTRAAHSSTSATARLPPWSASSKRNHRPNNTQGIAVVAGPILLRQFQILLCRINKTVYQGSMTQPHKRGCELTAGFQTSASCTEFCWRVPRILTSAGTSQVSFSRLRFEVLPAAQRPLPPLVGAPLVLGVRSQWRRSSSPEP